MICNILYLVASLHAAHAANAPVLIEALQGKEFTVVDSSGKALPLKEDDEVNSGDTLRTGKGTLADFLTLEGSAFRMGPDSEIEIAQNDHGWDLRLKKGTLSAAANTPENASVKISTDSSSTLLSGSEMMVVAGATTQAFGLSGSSLSYNPEDPIKRVSVNADQSFTWPADPEAKPQAFSKKAWLKNPPKGVDVRLFTKPLAKLSPAEAREKFEAAKKARSEKKPENKRQVEERLQTGILSGSETE
jgi:hypothetical protein